MAMVTSGLMNKQIAGEMGVSEVTVKVHRHNVMKKLGARSLPDLVRIADLLNVPQKRLRAAAANRTPSYGAQISGSGPTHGPNDGDALRS